MSEIKGVDPLSIPSSSRKRTARNQLQPNVKKTNADVVYNVRTHNYYDSLSEEEEEVEDPPHCHEPNIPRNQPRRIKIPVIIVYSYFANHVATISKLEKGLNEEVEVKHKGRRLIIITKNTMDYHSVRTELDAANIQYSTKTPINEREVKLIIKNMPPNIETEEIKKDLLAKKLPVLSVTQLTKKEDDKIICKYPLYMVTFDKGTDINTIIRYRKICYCIIQWERVKKSSVTQCYRCQAYGHISINCTRKPRCVICGQEHRLSECPNKQQPPKCINCNGPHTAGSRDCPRRPTATPRHAPARRYNSRPTPPPLEAFPPLRQNQGIPNTPVWPHPQHSAANNESPFSSISDILNMVRNLFQNFNLQKIINSIKTLMSRINAAPDGVSKLMIAIDFAVSFFG